MPVFYDFFESFQIFNLVAVPWKGWYIRNGITFIFHNFFLNVILD